MRPQRWIAVVCLVVFTEGKAVGEEVAVPVSFPDGFVLQAELAITPDEQATGLMFREQLPEDQGMLFVFEADEDRRFWMKHMRVDLDIVFLDPTFRVRTIVESVPHVDAATPDDRLPNAEGRGQYVLEVPAGTCQRHHLAVGDRVPIDLSGVAPP